MKTSASKLTEELVSSRTELRKAVDQVSKSDATVTDLSQRMALLQHEVEFSQLVVCRGCSRFHASQFCAAHFSAGLHCRTKSDAVHACKIIVLAIPIKSPLQRMTSNTCQLHCWRYMFPQPRNNSYISNSAKEQHASIEIAMARVEMQRNKPLS